MKYLAILLLTGLLFAGCEKNNPPKVVQSNIFPTFNHKLTIGGQNINVAIANTPETQQQGLSDYEKLNDTEGVLFDFRNNTNRRPTFWMKDMRFDLDMIWIRDNKVIGITKQVPKPFPETRLDELPRYPAPDFIDFVLEVNSGWSDRYGITIGSGSEIKE